MHPEQRTLTPEEIEVQISLNSQWNEVISGLGGREDLADEAFKEIVERYASGESRAYHNILHVARMISTVNDFSHLCDNPGVVRAAVFGHDIVYDSNSDTKEEDSARVTADILRKLEVPEHHIEEVKGLIMVTKEHEAEDDDADGKLIVDADYEILSASPSDYLAYAQGIVAENVGENKYTREQFAAGRTRYLNKWIDRIENDRLFYNKEIRDKLQPQAEVNIRAELSRISQMDF